MRVLRKEIKNINSFLVSLFIFLIFGISHIFGVFNFEINVVLIQFGLLFLGISLLLEKNSRETGKKLGFGIGLKKLLTYIILGFFSIFFYVIILGVLSNYLGVSDQYKVIERLNTFTPLVIFAAIIIGPISEELFFRGYLSRRTGILVSSVIFALMHFAYGSYVEIIGAFGIGLILAYIYIKSKSILPCILIHFLYNLFSILMFWWLY